MKVSLEFDTQGNSLAFAFDVPSACGWGGSEEAALLKLREDIAWMKDWLSQYKVIYDIPEEIEFKIVERIESTGKPLFADTEGFYTYDAGPLTKEYLMQSIDLLKYSRAELNVFIDQVPLSRRQEPLLKGKRTLNEVLNHIAIAEWWYMTRLDDIRIQVEDWRELNCDPKRKLEEVRKITINFLDEILNNPLKYSDISKVNDGEKWSYRKVIRRMVWHELWHVKELYRLLEKT